MERLGNASLSCTTFFFVCKRAIGHCIHPSKLYVLHVSCVQPKCVACLHLPLTTRHQSWHHICCLLQAQALLAIVRALRPTEQQTLHQSRGLTLAEAASPGRALVAEKLPQNPHRALYHLLLRETKMLSTLTSAIAAAQVRTLLAMWQACRMAGRLRTGGLLRQVPLRLGQQEQVSLHDSQLVFIAQNAQQHHSQVTTENWSSSPDVCCTSNQLVVPPQPSELLTQA